MKTGLSPHRWNERQYKSDVSTERVKRFRQRPRNGSETPPEQITEQSTTERGTAGLVEVTDRAALEAWDEHARRTTGKSYPRNRRGGWHFPTKWPPGHEAEIVQVIGRTA
jgi:hypothetical protein